MSIKINKGDYVVIGTVLEEMLKKYIENSS